MPSRAASACDLGGFAGDGQGGVGDGDVEVFGHLVLVDDLADLEPDPVRTGQPAGGDGGDRGPGCLRWREQLAAFAGPLGGQERVAAGDEAFPGVVGVADLGEVVLVEQGRLQRPAFGGEGLDRRCPQRGQPAQVGPVGTDRGDPGVGDHPAVPDHHQLGEPEPVPHHLDRLDERGRVGGVAGEHLDRDRTAGWVGEQSVLDLGPVLLPVPGVAPFRQRAVAALHPGGGQVEQRHPRRVGLRGQVALGELGLDGVLSAEQPVHRGIGLIGRRAGHLQVDAQGGVVPPGRGGQLRGRVHHPGDDQRHRQVPVTPGRAQQAGQTQRGGLRPHRRHMPVRQRAGDLLAWPAGTSYCPRNPASPVDHGRRQRGDVGQGLMLDLAVLAEGAAQVGDWYSRRCPA